MKERLKKISFLLAIMALSFAVSFYDLNGIYFLLAIPLNLSLLYYDRKHYIFGVLGMLIASFLLTPRILPIIVMISSSFTYFLALILRHFKMPIRIRISSLGAAHGFMLSWMTHFSPLKTPTFNLLIIPPIVFFICYNFIDALIDLQGKEDFSLNRKQLIIYGSFLSVLLYNVHPAAWSFRTNIFLVILLNYLIIRVDSLAGAVTTLVCIVLNLPYNLNPEIIFLVIPLIFSIKQVKKNHYMGALIYFAINLVVAYSVGDLTYLYEALLANVFILLIPEKLINFLEKFVVEPRDYELKLYQQNYYTSLNRNRKIQRVIDSLQEVLRKNPHMKKANREIILDDLTFLGNKLKEEENTLHLKENILTGLSYAKKDVIALRIVSDYLNNYQVCLEIENEELSQEQILASLEDNLKVKLKLTDAYHNEVMNYDRYFFVNEEKLSFNLSIKQRSKEKDSCGDSYMSFNTKNKKYLMISDGMGHGSRASIDSAQALLILKNLIELGMDPIRAIVSCNAIICDQGEEKFNTLDLLEYDTFSGTFYLYKNGSGTTYLKYDNKIEKKVSENLPLGIVENINVDKLNLEVNTGQIILTSDGLKKDLTDFLKNHKGHSINGLANDILNYEGKQVDDDQTIVVINVVKR